MTKSEGFPAIESPPRQRHACLRYTKELRPRLPSRCLTFSHIRPSLRRPGLKTSAPKKPLALNFDLYSLTLRKVCYVTIPTRSDPGISLALLQVWIFASGGYDKVKENYSQIIQKLTYKMTIAYITTRKNFRWRYL